MVVCLLVTNPIRLNRSGPTFCGTSHHPREGFWMIIFLKICLYQNSIFENLENPWNLFSIKSLDSFILFYNVFKQKMFTNEIEDESEAPFKSYYLNLQLPQNFSSLELLNNPFHRNIMFVNFSFWKISLLFKQINYLWFKAFSFNVPY